MTTRPPAVMPSRIPLLVPALAAAAVAIHLLPAGVAAALQFDRDALAGGAWWRLATAHLTHFDGNHLAWDVGVFLALGWAGERAAPRTTARALLAAAVAITLAVWAWQPQFAIYRGLSGLDCTLFALVATDLLRQRRAAPRLIGLLALLGLGGKCLLELATGATVFARGTGYDPVPLAHLVGATVGVVVPWLEAGPRRPVTSWWNRALVVANSARSSRLSPPCRISVPSSMTSQTARTIFSPACRTGPMPGRASRRPSRSTTRASIPPIAAKSSPA